MPIRKCNDEVNVDFVTKTGKELLSERYLYFVLLMQATAVNLPRHFIIYREDGERKKLK